MERKAIVFILLIALLGSFLSPVMVPKADASVDCLSLTPSSSASDKQYCQNELNQIEAELNTLLAEQAAQSKQTGTLKGDVDYLNAQINALKVKIRAQQLVIARLRSDITDKTNTIDSLSNKIGNEQDSLAQLLRDTNEFDNQNLINLVLSDDTISSFYNDLETYETLKKSVKDSIDIITGVKTQTEVVKQSLEQQQAAQTAAQVALENAQTSYAKSQADKKQLLSISQQKESAYAQLAADKKAQADKIRAALFQLRDTSAIPFGMALTYAKLAQSQTAVAPAFLLAIITQESNLGTDTGSCYVTNFSTGSGISSKSGQSFAKVMSPTRDIPPFKIITSALGLDASSTLVSCPIGGYGWGGAMGPAQFIPSTWMGIKDDVASALGISTEPNPWSARDAFMASAIFLQQLGAAGGSYSNEIKAACRYYGTGGSTCAYGRNVMSRVASIQKNIDLISD